jgi:cytochrome c
MGVSSAGRIQADLLSGLPGRTPVAIVQRASLPDQRHAVTTLAELAATIEREAAGQPVGDRGRRRAATAKEAEAMVKKGVAFIKANGKDKGYAEITDRDNKEFHDRDLYLAVHRLDGTAVAHGTNEKMVGKNFIEMKDIDGKEYIKERVDFAKTKTTLLDRLQVQQPGQQEDRAEDRVLRTPGRHVVCGGIYKK